uniref:Uncharacterized protein n=1 Tax=Amphimedon queenslandica TaxID=400682 RepID=A0A1X7U2F3_AMPQE
ILENFRGFAKTCQLFTKDQEVLHIVDELLQNQQCSIFPSMQAKKDEHEDSIYQMIVVHSVLTILTNRKTGHMKMLLNFISSPETLKLESFCIHCGRIIQYSSKSLAPVDKFTKNEASPGYIPLNDMERNPPTGFLSNASYAIIRCIMHSCLLWSSCNGKNISPLMNGKLDLSSPEYNLFFWDQIKKDIQQLSSITGHSIDEAALLVHLVLKQINEKGHHVQLTGQNVVGNLVKLDDRRKWEKQFYDCYIEPVVKDTGSSIQKMLKELTARDYSKLFGAVYMTPMTSSKPFLWNVYPTLTSQQICGQLLTIKVSEQHPVIFTYLSEAHRFQAMKFLPDIIKMLKITQKAISQFDYDEKTQGTIENMSFGEFVNQIDDQQKDDYESFFVSFQQAWELCHHELDNERLFELKNNSIQAEISKKMKMKHLIPTTYGPGVITTGLIDHLVISHNKFIRLCCKFVEDSLKKNWLWQSPKVPLQELNSKHFVKCSDEFVRLVQSHSVYTISNGNVTIQINDLGIIERDFVQEFVLGKPIITQVLDIPQVIWKRPVLNTQIIAAVKKNITQQALPPLVRSGILMDLKNNLAEMTVTCETVETVMRFLQRKKEPSKKKLKEYVEKELIIIGKLRSEKITDFCCLEHVVPLWRFLNVERAKYRVRNEEDPFTVKSEFMEELDDEQQKVSLEAAISKMTNIDNMLEVMYEMIQTYVQTCHLEDKHKQLRVVLFDYVYQTKSESIFYLMELFPPDIKLSQVACTWKEIVHLHDATKKKNR